MEAKSTDPCGVVMVNLQKMKKRAASASILEARPRVRAEIRPLVIRGNCSEGGAPACKGAPHATIMKSRDLDKGAVTLALLANTAADNHKGVQRIADVGLAGSESHTPTSMQEGSAPAVAPSR